VHRRLNNQNETAEIFTVNGELSMSTSESRINRDEKLFKFIERVHSKSTDLDHQILKRMNRHLHQYGLHTIYTPKDVFNEAVIRAITKFKSGEIENLPAWFNLTGLNIVKEWSRTEKKQLNIRSSYELKTEPYLPALNVEVFDLYDALERLDPNERELLTARASGKSWQDIAQESIDRGDETGDVATLANTLAKRHSRLLRRHRTQY
jgi:DNA-directed RNA polymerase specialized sigma24 family protein